MSSPRRGGGKSLVVGFLLGLVVGAVVGWLLPASPQSGPRDGQPVGHTGAPRGDRSDPRATTPPSPDSPTGSGGVTPDPAETTDANAQSPAELPGS